MILQHLCKLRCNLLCCFKFNQWLRNFTRMGACCCSEFDGESYEAAGNLRNHSRWRSGCQIPERNNLWAQNLIHIRIPFCWFNEEIGVPFPSKLWFLHARSPGISNSLHQIFSWLLMSCWVHTWIQEELSSDESSDEGTPPVKHLPGVTLRDLEGAALRTGNLDVSSDHGGGWCGLVVVGPGWFFEMTYMILYDHIWSYIIHLINWLDD